MSIAPLVRWLVGGCLALAAAACADAPVEPPPPVEGNTPVRKWEFYVRSTATGPLVVVASGSQTGGEVLETHDFGPSILEPEGPGSDDRANGDVFSSADGVTYWVSTEDGDGLANTVLLEQRQSFRKNAANATLELEVTEVVLRGLDDNFDVYCPEAAFCPIVMDAGVQLLVAAFDESEDYFLEAGNVSLEMRRNEWVMSVGNEFPSFWDAGDFLPDLARTLPRVNLSGTVVVPVDISRVPVGSEFTLGISAVAWTYNAVGGETYLSSHLRDPLQVGGNAAPTLRFSGLQPTNDPLPMRPRGSLGVAPECTAPNPAAGTIQFPVASYALGESPTGGTDGIVVTRTGGTTGAVSATLRTSNGTAVAGTDYTALTRTVAFADGDAGPRVIPVPTLPNGRIDGERTVNLTLTDPRGCATLGAASSVLTIHDDDAPPADESITIGGTVSGLAGSGLVLRNVIGGEELAVSGATFTFARRTAPGLDYDVVVATQPASPAQVCTVANGRGTAAGAAVTDVAVTCITPTAVAGLDPTFGTGGRVATSLASSEGQAVVVQPDGKIVVAGRSAVAATPGGAASADFTLLRYLADGSPDAAFGTGGRATAGFAAGRTDEAFDVAVQADGRIVVVGRTQAANGDYDFGLARFTADGRLDPTFGTGGVVITDFGAGSAYAQAVVIQADGRIVVAGHSTVGIGNDFALARYDTDGTLDASFGTGGRVTTNIAGRTDLAFAVALAPDGRIVVGGRAEQSGGARDDFGLARYDANGTLDPTFGTGGIVTTDFAGGRNEQVNDVIVLADGRIVAAGYSGASTGTFDVALARYTTDGRLDASFGTGGRVMTDLSGADDFGEGLAVQADGRLVVVGRQTSATAFDLALVRYLADGAPDASFGTAGRLAVDFFGASDQGQGIAIQPDGRIVGAGHALNGTAPNIVLVRVVP